MIKLSLARRTAVAVTAAVGCVAALAGCGGAGRPAAASSPASPSPTVTVEPSASASAVASPEVIHSVGVTTVTTPKTLLGRSKTTDKGTLTIFHQAFDRFRTTGGAFAEQSYGSIPHRNTAMFLAAESNVPDPQEMLTVAGDLWFKGTTFHSVDPGPLGGAAECTSVVAGHTKATQCVWASPTVFGIFYIFFLDPKKAEAEFRKARAQIEIPQTPAY